MYIGNVEIHSKLYLAPMAGVTDLAFRQICRELGAGMSCTELVSAKALCYQDKKSRGLLKLAPNEKPAAAQIFGSDIPCMAEAAVIAAEVSGADIIDINMGCPVGKVVANGDGSALMKDPEKAARLAEAVVKARDGENAPGLGQGQHQRGGAGENAGAGRRQCYCRPRPHPHPNVQRSG